MRFARVARILASCPALLVAIAVSAHADTKFGSKPVQLIVGFTPGGGTDIVARTIAPILSKELGAIVVVDNKPGAGGIIAADFVAKANPDGATLLVASAGPFTIAPYLNKLPYDPVKDFTLISQLTIYPNIMVAGAETRIKTVAELISTAKQNPGKFNYASTGSGATPHLAFAYFNMLTGIDLNHVPYKGNPQAVADVLGGRVEFYIGDPSAVLPHIHSGRLNALAVTTKERSVLFPEIPSMADAGQHNFDVPLWHGLVGPKGLPDDIAKKLLAAVKVVADDRDVKTAFEKAGLELKSNSPAEFMNLMNTDRARWKQVIEVNNIKAE